MSDVLSEGLRRLTRLPQGTVSHRTPQLIRMFSIAGEWQLFICLHLDVFIWETRAFEAVARRKIHAPDVEMKLLQGTRIRSDFSSVTGGMLSKKPTIRNGSGLH